MGDVFEHVEARDALRREKLRRVGFVLLKRRGEHVARLHLLPPRALHVKNGRLQHTAKRERLLRLLLLPARELLDGVVQILVEILAQLRQIGAARREDPFPIEVMRQRVEQVLERQVRMPA